MEPVISSDPEPSCCDGDQEKVISAFESIEREAHPTAEDIDFLVQHLPVLSRLGLVDRSRALLQRWRRLGFNDGDITMAEAMLTALVPSASASNRLRALARADTMSASVDVINCVWRGELKPAIDMARAHDFFLDHPDSTEGLTFALWALALEDQFEQALAVIESWKRRHASTSPERYQLMLRLESRVACLMCDFPRELALLEEARALCERYQLDTACAFGEPAHAGALARNGELSAARNLIATWAPSTREQEESPLTGFRNLARMEVALLEERYSAATTSGRRALRFCSATKNAVLTCSIRFGLTLAASKKTFVEELEAYRKVVSRFQTRYHLEKLKLLERVAASDKGPARDVALAVRSRTGRTCFPLVRLWSPRVEWVATDIFWDGIRGKLHIRGRGPVDLSDYPVLFKVMKAIVRTPDFAVPIPELFTDIWSLPYDPFVHEGKVHVTVHRLRKCLARCCPDAKGMITVRDGVVLLDEAFDICAVGPSEGDETCVAGAVGLSERVVQCLSASVDLPPRDLERRLGVSRSALNAALRGLIAANIVKRIGKGRSIRYHLTSP